VAPVSLLENWEQEASKFLVDGRLKLLVAYGDALAALRVPRENVDEQLRREGLVRFLRADWLGAANVVLTTYGTLRDLEFSFAAVKWSVMICDEAQRITIRIIVPPTSHKVAWDATQIKCITEGRSFSGGRFFFAAKESARIFTRRMRVRDGDGSRAPE
jgi:hypothetical protein